MNKLKTWFSHRDVGFYLEMGNALFVLIVTILALTIDGGHMKIDDNSKTMIAVGGFVGVALDVLALALPFKITSDFLPLFATAFYAIAAGRSLELFAYPLADRITGVNWFGGSFNIYFIFFLLLLIGTIISVVVCFLRGKERK